MRKKTMLLRLVFIAAIIFCANSQLYGQSVILTETEVKEDGSAVKILFATNRSIAVECYDLAVPPQIIVDFMGDVYYNGPEIKTINKGVVRKMRIIKGTKTSPDLDESYYSVDFIIIDLKESVRYDFDQGLTTSVLMVSKPGKPKQKAQAVEEAARMVVRAPVAVAKSPVAVESKPAAVKETAFAIQAKPKTEAAKPAKKKTFTKKITSGIKNFFTFGRARNKTPEQIKAQKEKVAKKKEAKRVRKVKRAKRAKKKKTFVDPTAQAEAAKKKVANAEVAVFVATEQLKVADDAVKASEEGQATIGERVEFCKAKAELAKDAYDTSLKYLKVAKSAANSVWIEYSSAKTKLGSFLEKDVEEKVLAYAQKSYDDKKAELDKVIKGVEAAKKESDAKLEEYNKAKQEGEKLSTEAANPAKTVAKAKEEYVAKENKLKQKNAELDVVKKKLADAELAKKKYELEKADEEYRESFNLIDSQMLKQLEEDEKQAKAQLAALAALEAEAENKKATTKRKSSRQKRRKVKVAEKKTVRANNGRISDRLESAVELRNAGLEMQRTGDFDSAVKYYQQALLQDSKYATVHNDLGILYEQKGLENRAKMEYLTTLKINPQYIKAHSNLALLYEKLGDYKKAHYHWKQRVNLGREDDPWTRKAKQRMQLLEKRK